MLDLERQLNVNMLSYRVSSLNPQTFGGNYLHLTAVRIVTQNNSMYFIS